MEKKCYDKESVYDQEITPLVEKIYDICQEHKIPVFAMFGIASKDGGESCATTCGIFEKGTGNIIRTVYGFTEYLKSGGMSGSLNGDN